MNNIFSLFVFAVMLSFFVNCSLGATSAPISSVEMFVSNNTSEISLATAYTRLMGASQQNLQAGMIHTLQVAHIEQGTMTNILGAYTMSRDHDTFTADNTEAFIFSPFESLSDSTLFALAKSLALQFNQESVAMFIPGGTQIGEVKLTFSHPATIVHTMNMLKINLPASYSQAFSLSIANSSANFNNAQVSVIEWLGHTDAASIQKIKQAYPNDRVTFMLGRAFLIYQNGKVEVF
jgi:hypothetical protein